MGKTPEDSMEEDTPERKTSTGRGISWFQALMVVLLVVAIYHVFLTKCFKINGRYKIYTTNADVVHDMLFQKVMSGKMEMDMFKSVVSNMENQINARLKDREGFIVLNNMAVIAGGEQIIFGAEGFIENDPEKALTTKDQIEKAVAIGQEKKQHSLRDAIDGFRGDVEEITRGNIK